MMPDLDTDQERAEALDGRYPTPPCLFCGTSEWDSSKGWVPFKGADESWVRLATNGVGGWAVECAGCGSTTGEFGSAGEAMGAWARRSPVRAVPSEGKRLCTVRLACELFEQMVHQGHVFTHADTLTVTKGLPEDARLIGVRFESHPAPIIYLEYEHTSGDIPDGEEIVVEFTQGFADRLPGIHPYPHTRLCPACGGHMLRSGPVDWECPACEADRILSGARAMREADGTLRVPPLLTGSVATFVRQSKATGRSFFDVLCHFNHDEADDAGDAVSYLKGIGHIEELEGVLVTTAKGRNPDRPFQICGDVPGHPGECSLGPAMSDAVCGKEF